MKKITSTYFCDKCGKEITYQQHFMIYLPKDRLSTTFDLPKDICEDCLMALHKWFGNENNEFPFETTGMG